MSKLLFNENQDEKLLKKPARHWAATFWKKPDFKPDEVRYMILGEEICPKTGKIHWQGYLEFYKPIRMTGVKNCFNDKTIHLGIRFKSRENARDYCKKDNKFEESGYWISGQGHRSDLFDVVEDLKNGKKISDIIEENPQIYCQYRNGLKDIAAHYSQKRVPKTRPVEVILLTGPTRCGKTRMAMAEKPFKMEGYKLKWWDGYDEEKCILIDDYNNDVNINVMLNLLDIYPLKLETKGSHTHAHWNKVYITTNLKLYEIHPNAKPEHRKAFFARCSKIINFWDEDKMILD